MALEADLIVRSFRFQVEILPNDGSGTQDNKITTGFQTVSGLSDETETIEYREGDDSDVISTYPGTLSFGEITLERGLTNEDNGELLLDWRRSCNNAQEVENLSDSGTGDQPWNYRRDIKITVNEDVNEQGMIYEIKDAWCSALEFSDLDAESSDVLVETLTVQHEGYEITHPSRA